MGAYESIDVANASKVAATNGHEIFLAVGNGNILPPERWFMRIAHSLWPDKPSAWLRSLTGFPDRTCRSAANGHTDPSGPLLYTLLRGNQGGRVLNGIMHGSDAEWWREHERAERIATQLDKLDLR